MIYCKPAEIWVCVDCFFEHHTPGETELPEGVTPWSLYPDALMGDITDWSDPNNETGDDPGTIDFSSRRCDGCDSHLAGTRHRFAYAPALAHFVASTLRPTEGVWRMNERAVVELASDDTSPRNPYVTGYGGKIPTRHRILLGDGRWRRVYVMQYGNSGSPYVNVAGKDAFLPSDVEHQLSTQS